MFISESSFKDQQVQEIKTLQELLQKREIEYSQFLNKDATKTQAQKNRIQDMEESYDTPISRQTKPNSNNLRDENQHISKRKYQELQHEGSRNATKTVSFIPNEDSNERNYTNKDLNCPICREKSFGIMVTIT